MHPATPSPFSIERLEPRVCPSGTVAITFDPDGTLVEGTGTVGGQKYIQISSVGGSGGFDTPGGGIGGGGGEKGKALVFATDFDGDGIVDPNEITGIAFTDNVKAVIYGDVNGDIVTNLRGNGELSGEAKDGTLLLGSSIPSLEVRGSVHGNILAGKGIGTLKIAGSVEEIRLGTAAGGQSFRFHGPDGGSVTLAPFVLDTNKDGGRIQKVTIGTGVAGMYASDGGAGGRGGEINTVRILSDTGGVIFQAGDGGDREDRRGGHGGYLTGIRYTGSGDVTLLAGRGGDSPNGNSRAGDGGWIDKCRIETDGRLTVRAGDGGNNPSVDSSGGTGGWISKFSFRAGSAEFRGGHGGDGHKRGGDGGSLLGLKGWLGGEGNFFAGHGGDAVTSGGIGGEIAGLAIKRSHPDAFVRAIVAGDGGDGTLLNGGGGSLRGIRFDGDIGDFSAPYGVEQMGGLFAGLAGSAPSGGGLAGLISGVNALRVAAVVAGTGPAPQPIASISGLKAAVLGANHDTEPNNEGVVEPAFDFFRTAPPGSPYLLGEQPIDGLVLAVKVSGLKTVPLFVFITGTNTQLGTLDPRPVP